MRTLFFIAAVFLISGPTAHAHTYLAKSTPAEGAVLSAAPQEVIFEFSGPARLTAASVQKDGEKQSIRLRPAAKEPAARVKVPVEAPLGAGTYVVTWRALGADNHIVSGKLRFTIAPR